MSDIENNNAQLEDIKTQMKNLMTDCKQLYGTFDEKKKKVLELRASGAAAAADFATSAWGDSAWSNAPSIASDAAWPVDDTAVTANSTNEAVDTGVCKYRALYEFVARNQDEISFQPGDIISVCIINAIRVSLLSREIYSVHTISMMSNIHRFHLCKTLNQDGWQEKFAVTLVGFLNLTWNLWILV